jgi:hypothetical protein
VTPAPQHDVSVVIPTHTERRWQSLVLQMIEPTNDSGAYNVRVARLSTGKLEALPMGLPAETLQLLVGSSDGMSTAGRKLSF